VATDFKGSLHSDMAPQMMDKETPLRNICESEVRTLEVINRTERRPLTSSVNVGCDFSVANDDTFDDRTLLKQRGWALGGGIFLVAIFATVGMAIAHGFRHSDASLRHVVELEQSSGDHIERNGSNGNNRSDDFFDDALYVLAGKDTTSTMTTMTTTTLTTKTIGIFNVDFPWHEDDESRRDVRKTLYRQTYKGHEGMWCVGLNTPGFEGYPSHGRYGNFAGPGFYKIKFFHGLGANCFRMPITWERLQSRLGSDELDPVPGVETIVDYITNTLGQNVIITPANGLTHTGHTAMRSDFVSLWAAMSKKWGSNPRVIFELVDIPHGGFEDGQEGYFNPDSQDNKGKVVEFWRQWSQAAIDAIRSRKAINLILVPGLHWSTCAEWGGAAHWGEALDGMKHHGNTRLASLEDPLANLAYSVHQPLDSNFTGYKPGCEGYASANEGLQRTILWAKRYKKKLMMTEVGSIPAGDDSDKNCRGKVNAFIHAINASGVFLGYQALGQGGNLDWYSLHEYGRPCSVDLVDCRDTQCCQNPASQCYLKNPSWAHCKPACKPNAIDLAEDKDLQTNWTCTVLNVQERYCSNDGEDCSKTRCCNDPSKQCYRKEKGWAVCRSGCTAGQIWVDEDVANRKPWECALLANPDAPKMSF